MGEGINVRTARGLIPRSVLKPTVQDGNGSDILLTDKGSRIGVVFVPSTSESNFGKYLIKFLLKSIFKFSNF